jgi:general secretion pathway protein G
MDNRRRPHKWLVVVMFALAILPILTVATILFMHGPNNSRNYRVLETLNNIRNVKSAILVFDANNGRLPTRDEGLEVLVRRPPSLMDTWRGPYIESVPRDGWGHPFQYVVPGSGKQRFDVVSPGEDGIMRTNDDIFDTD